MKTSVSQLKHPLDGALQSDPKYLKPSASQDNIITRKNRLKGGRTAEKREQQASSLTTALENVQRLNAEIKNQSSELRQNTSFAALEQQRKNQNPDSGSASRRQPGHTSVNSIDVSLGQHHATEEASSTSPF